VFRIAQYNLAREDTFFIGHKKRGRPFKSPPKIAGGHDGYPRALTIVDVLRISFKTVRDGHRKICLIETQDSAA